MSSHELASSYQMAAHLMKIGLMPKGCTKWQMVLESGEPIQITSWKNVFDEEEQSIVEMMEHYRLTPSQVKP